MTTLRARPARTEVLKWCAPGRTSRVWLHGCSWAWMDISLLSTISLCVVGILLVLDPTKHTNRSLLAIATLPGVHTVLIT